MVLTFLAFKYVMCHTSLTVSVVGSDLLLKSHFVFVGCPVSEKKTFAPSCVHVLLRQRWQDYASFIDKFGK